MRRTLSHLPPLVCAVLGGALLAPLHPSDASAAPPAAPMPHTRADLAPMPKAVAHPVAKKNTSGIEYNRDIRPILAENCFACHGPDSAARKAGLRIDQRDAALEMKAIVPGNPDESEMIRRILTDDPRNARLYVEVIGSGPLKDTIGRAERTLAGLLVEALLADTDATAHDRARLGTASLVIVVGIAQAVSDWLDGAIELSRSELVDEIATMSTAAARAVRPDL